jgi:hypothetical protein
LIQERYFAAAPPRELGEKLWNRFEAAQLEQTPRAARWFAAYAHAYGDETEAGRTWGMSRRGEAGELAAVRINRVRRASKARQQLILSGRVAFRARCKTQDSDAELAQLISQTWLEHDFKENGMEQLWRQGVEYSEFFAEAYAFTEYDWTRGEDVQTPHGIRRDGGARTTLVPPWLVSTDNSVASPKDRNWWFVCTSRPKADLTMLYPRIRRGSDMVEGDLAELAIYDAKPFMVNNRLAWYGQRTDLDRSLEDNAEVVTFIHYPTLRFPLGRFVRLLGPDCVLEDRPLIGDHGDYDETALPLHRLSADEMAGTPHAWTTFYDALANQELLDGIDTSAATIVTGFGTPMYAIEKNSGEKPEKLVLGMRPWLVAPGGKTPELIQRPEIASSMMEYRETLSQDIDKTFAINDDATGQTNSSDKNAQAEALRASMAVQQVSAQSGEARGFLRRIMECRLKTTRKNMQGERLLKAVGEAERHMLEGSRFFTAAKLEPLDNVELEEANPLEDTVQGRQAMLDFYGQRNLIKSQEDVESVMRTGRLAKALDPIRSENMLVESENEMLARGEAPMAYPTQNDVLHMRQHACVTMSVAALKNPKVLQAYDAHDREHWLNRFGCDRDSDPLYRPRYEFVMGRGPEPQAQIPPPAMVHGMVPPQQPGAPQMGQPQPLPNGPGLPQPMSPKPIQGGMPGGQAPAPTQPAGAEKPVNLPKNPLTKQQFSPGQAPLQEAPQA